MYTLVVTMNWNRFRNIFRIRFCIFYNRSELSHCTLLFLFFFCFCCSKDLKKQTNKQTNKKQNKTKQKQKQKKKKNEQKNKKQNKTAACFYTPVVLKLLIIVHMWKQHEEEHLVTILFTPHLSKLIKYCLLYGTSKVQSTHFQFYSKSYWDYWPYWLASQWAQYLRRGIWTTYLLMRWFFLCNPILFLIYNCVEINRWLLLFLKICNLKKLASSWRPQMKESSCSFNMVKIMVKERWCLIGMLDAGMRINNNIDSNWANEVCKWSVAITICSLSYILKSKELDNETKISAWGDKWFKSPAVILNQSIW